jgi:hypothetical protein
MANDEVTLKRDGYFWIATHSLSHNHPWLEWRGPNLEEVVADAFRSLEEEAQKAGQPLVEHRVFKHLTKRPEGPREGAAGSGIGGTMGDNPFASGVR